MSAYLTTYDAGVAKAVTAAGTHDPADANSGEWDGTDDGHPTAADKPVEDRVPWDVPVPPTDPAIETPAEAPPPPEGGVLQRDPPVGSVHSDAPTAIEGDRA
jgi:hypothetical protein